MAKPLPEEVWKAKLSEEQYRVLRQKRTELPHKGKYVKHDEKGVYHCAGCKTPLYRSETKFPTACGWPAFYEALEGAVVRQPDADRPATEILCGACGGHLGHLFAGEGFEVPTDERHCVNSVSLEFKKEGNDSKWKMFFFLFLVFFF